MTVAPHPAADELAAFLAGRLSAADSTAVQAHLDGCGACQEVAAGLPEDAFPAEVRAGWEWFRGGDPGGPPDRSGERLGDFRLVRRVGGGGMGVVYEAVQESLGRTVALKLLAPHAAADPRYLARFRREARVAAGLHHTHIVPVFGVGEHAGTHYYVMQLIRGRGLDRVARGGAVPPADAARLGRQAADALAYAHAQGVLHRDVKPANLLLADDGLVWVADFGLAKGVSESDLTATGDVLGTLRYMAPERFDGAADARSDVYALGLTLYELLAGRPAFDETNPQKLIRRVVDGGLPPLGRAAGVPPDLETVVRTAADRDPARRYPTAAALAADLGRFLDGRPIAARRTGPLEHGWRWCRRNPAVAALLAALAASLLAGTAAVTWKWRAEAHARADAVADKERAVEARAAAERTAAWANLEVAVGDGEQGAVDRALLQFAHLAGEADRLGDADLARVARTNLAGWRGQLVRPRQSAEHPNWVTAVAYAPDGRLAVTACRDGSARLWEVATGRPHGEPMPHPAPVWAARFSPDGRTVLTAAGSEGGKGGEARLWDAATGMPLGPPFAGGAPLEQAEFGRDGKTLLVADEEAAELWDWSRTDAGATCARRAAIPGPVTAATFTPDGHRVLVAGGPAARRWDAATGRPVGPEVSHPPHGELPARVAAVAVSPDGRTLATAAQYVDRPRRRFVAGEVRLWRVETGEPVGRPLAAGPVKVVAFSPDGRLLLAGGVAPSEPGPGVVPPGEARVWEVGTGRPLLPPVPHPEPVWAAAFAPDGRTFLTGCEDGNPRLWQTATGARVGPDLRTSGNAIAVGFAPDGRTALVGHTYQPAQVQTLEVPPGTVAVLTPRHTERVVTLAASPDAKWLLSVGDEKVARVWDAAGRPAHEFRGAAAPVAFSGDGRTLAAAAPDNTVRVFDPATGTPHGPDQQHPMGCFHLEFLPGGAVLFQVRAHRLGPQQAEVGFWDVATGKPVHPPHEVRSVVWAAALAPDGRSAAAGFGDGTAVVLDAATGRPRYDPLRHPGAVRAVAYSPDGRLIAAACEDGVVRLWDAATGRPHGPPLTGSREVTFSPDGRTLATAGVLDVRLWVVETGEPVGPALQHRDIVRLAFSPDGATLATASEDGTARLWDAATGRRLGPPLRHPAKVYAAVFRAGGRSLATAADDGVIRVWDVPAPVGGDPARLREWAELLTGGELADRGVLRPIDAGRLHRRRGEFGLDALDPRPLVGR